MESDSCPFSLLPAGLCYSFLKQAFKQLDQRHLYGIVPLVCQAWDGLALSSSTSIDAKISTLEAADQLGSWMQKHGSELSSFRVSLEGDLQQLVGIDQTVELTLGITLPAIPPDYLRIARIYVSPASFFPSLTTLSNLSSLSLHHLDTLPLGQWSALLQMTQLVTLDLSHTNILCSQAPFWAALSRQLTRLTSLDASRATQAARKVLHHIGLDSLAPLSSLQALKSLTLAEAKLQEFTCANLPPLPIVSCDLVLPFFGSTCVCEWLQRSAGNLQQLRVYSESVPFTIHDTYERPVMMTLRQAAPQLRELTVIGVCLSSCVQLLGQLSQLTSLTLSNCHLDDAAVSKLSALFALRSLSLRDNAEVTGAEGSMACLAAGLSKLTSLDLSGTGAGEAAVGAFGAQMMEAGPVLMLKPVVEG